MLSAHTARQCMHSLELAPKGEAALACPNTLPVLLAPKLAALLAAPNPNPVGALLVPGAAAPKPTGAAAGGGALLPFFTPAA